ncbi:hypothetical protein [Cellulophaga baltica]|uniref:DNA cytosine methyltransferase n=1 Tax=Cellulophaga baltica 18 TaxID=1348584 RepID=A0AAU8RCI0_9FLAO|nr:hypothetical protein [Cellulophaga baltica]AIZ41226.1 hypothetical protein M666_06360 [Cellulophaga baltica 18]
MNVLIACEESQTVCKAFRNLGIEAFSCDILPSSGGYPEWHFNSNVFEIIDNNGGILENGEEHFIDGNWDLMIAHPPCTYLAVSGARWFYHPDDKHLPTSKRRPHPRFPDRAKKRDEALEFFIKLCESPIERIAVENPVGTVNTKYRKPDQTVQPWMFGDEASKKTCLWLKNLPDLVPTNIVGEGERVVLSSGRSLPKWYSDSFHTSIPTELRRTLRSKTFQGFADAIALQWSNF